MKLAGKNFQPWGEFGLSIDGLTLIVGPSNKGKCFSQGTPILMYDGTIKPVEQIRNGDMIMGPDSRPRIVSGTTSGQEPMYRIVPVKGESWDCNESHTLSLMVWRGKHNRHIKKVEISVHDYLQKSKNFRHCSRLYRPSSIQFSKRFPVVEPYFIGYWLGDGTSDNQGITTADNEVVSHLSEVSKRFNLDIRINEKTPPSSAKTYMLTDGRGKGKPRAGRNRLLSHLQQLGIIGDKHIPISYKISTVSDRLELLAGLLDSDGHLEYRSQYEYTSIIHRLAEDTAFVARSLGFSCTIHPKPKGGTPYCYRVRIRGNLSRIPTKIRRKQAPHIPHKDPLRTGFKVLSLGLGDFFGFSVDKDGLFLLGDFTVVHNSSVFRSLRGILRNELSAEYVRNGQDERMEVTLEADGISSPIRAARTRKGSTKYEIGSEKFAALGDSIPEPMKALKFGTIRVGDTVMDPIFSTQNKSQFLIDPDMWKPSDLNAVFGAFSSTEKLDAGKKETNLRITQRNSDAKALAGEIREAEERRGNLDRLEKEASSLAKLSESFEFRVNRYESQAASVREAAERLGRLSRMRGTASGLHVPDVSKADVLDRRARLLAQAAALSSSTVFLRSATESLDGTVVSWNAVTRLAKRRQAVLALLGIAERKGIGPKECGERLEGVLREANTLLGSISHHLSVSRGVNLLSERLGLPSRKSELKFVGEELDAASARVNSLALRASEESGPKCPACGKGLVCPDPTHRTGA